MRWLLVSDTHTFSQAATTRKSNVPAQSCSVHYPLSLFYLGWDLEQNKAIRNYHGHLNGVYSVAVHPVHDILVTAGRDAVARVWDIRTKGVRNCAFC